MQSAARKIKQNWLIYLIALPGLAYFVLFHFVPLYGVGYAFKEFSFRGFNASEWNGLENFKDLFRDRTFLRAFRNTLLYSAGRIVFEFPVPILLALLINEVRISWFKRIIQSVMYLPYFLSWVVIYSLLLSLLSVDDGMINSMRASMGLQRLNFLTNSSSFIPIVFLSNIWKMAGYSTIVYLAAITSIDPSLYEAAWVDGANRLQRALHVTLPGMAGVIFMLFILNIGNVMNAGFDQIYNIYNKAVMDVADIIDTFIYREGIMYARFSMATASGLFKSVINLIFLLIVNSVSHRVKGVGLYE